MSRREKQPNPAVVGERTIEHRDDHGGWAWDVIDFETDRKRLGKYFVWRLPIDLKAMARHLAEVDEVVGAYESSTAIQASYHGRAISLVELMTGYPLCLACMGTGKLPETGAWCETCQGYGLLLP